MDNMGYFQGRKAVIATKHNKEEVIKPIMENELGLLCYTSPNLDTDLLGTFSGEVERLYDPITTLRKKCEMAIEATGTTIAIANEGSFGSHPTLFFTYADDEFIMLIDKDNKIEIVERELTVETNFDAKEINFVDELLEFATKIGFPTHGIMLKKGKNNLSGHIKESKSIEELIENYLKIKNSNGIAYAETDMRAMNNPTRMKIIERATYKLANKANSLCAICKTPGFGVIDSIEGLPCQLCGMPTKSIRQHIYCCQKCNYKQLKEFPFNKKFEEPQFCNYCNP